MFQSLTVSDLINARSRHHIRLATQYTNVVGTAIGFFRYRKTDESFDSAAAADKRLNVQIGDQSIGDIKKQHTERTIENSEVKSWSPPCILVFVDEWLRPEEFRSHPERVIESFIETDDSRLVPTCIVFVRRYDAPPAISKHLNFPEHLYGGGYIVKADVQGKEHVSSIGCLVTDGDLTFALTNRHVTGTQPGRVINTYVNNRSVPIGRSYGESIGKVPSSQVYSKWSSKEAYSNIDAGLILLDDLNRWTTQVYGVGRLNEPFQINFDQSLETCIGLKVKAFGGASGELRGEIVGLFYRYKALGGYDFIADFLIGARDDGDGDMRTLPGDSGTLWVVDPDEPGTAPDDDGTIRKDASRLKDKTSADKTRDPAPWYSPIALQWGGQVTLGVDGRSKYNFALATSVENACRLLDVSIVRDWNIGHPEYWGEMGHYTIGLKACDLISSASPMLKDLMSKNSESVGFDEDLLKDPNKYHKKKAGYKNVPLADVPDNVWRNPTQYGGRQGRPGHPELNNDGNNHFADMDQPGVDKYKGKTLMDLYKADPGSLTIDTWNEFYELLNNSGNKINPGALPFRVWQGFDAMVEYLSKPTPDVVGFFCVAGTMAHYIGDSCQPLHISRLHHGYPEHMTATSKRVHDVYETLMLDNNGKAVLSGLTTRLKKKSAKSKPKMKTGADAARGVVELMIATFERLPPKKIVDTYNLGTSADDRAQKLWQNYKEETLDNMAGCCTFLASVWESAWSVAGAENKVKAAQIRKFDYEDDLHETYKPEAFYESVSLPLMKQFCK